MPSETMSITTATALLEVAVPLTLIERHQTLALTREQSDAFLNALANPPTPNTALEAAFKRHRNND